jgi:hypothetical protein
VAPELTPQASKPLSVPIGGGPLSAADPRKAYEILLETCKVDTPIVRKVPKLVLSQFAKTWGGLLEVALKERSVKAWRQFLVFPKVILLAPLRGGKKLTKNQSLTNLFKARLDSWFTRTDELWEEVVKRFAYRDCQEAKKKTPGELAWKTDKKVAEDRKKVEKAAVGALRLGDVKKALRTLCSAPIAPKCDATFKALEALHPKGSTPQPVPDSGVHSFDADTVRRAVKSFGPGSAGGLFAYTPLLLQQCMQAESWSFARQLTTVVNQLARGDAPSFLQPFLAGGRSIALQKPGSGVRPLCCGDPLRRLVAKCFCLAGKDEIAQIFKGRNYGVGCPGGVEIVAHSLRDVLQKHSGSKLGLLKIDFANAFNSIDRSAFMQATCEVLPTLSRWTNWCYSTPPLLLYSHSKTLLSSSGVQQGDPLGPLYFCFGIASLVKEIQDLNPLYNKWYMDDGGMVADVATLKKVWGLLAARSPALGLKVNVKKCEWSWLDASCSLPSPIEGVPLVPTDEIAMLGVPLGSKSKNSTFIQQKLSRQGYRLSERLR